MKQQCIYTPRQRREALPTVSNSRARPEPVERLGSFDNPDWTAGPLGEAGRFRRAPACDFGPQSRDGFAPDDTIGDLAGRSASMFQAFLTRPNERQILITAYFAKTAFCKCRGRRRDVGESNWKKFLEFSLTEPLQRDYKSSAKFKKFPKFGVLT